MNPAPPPSQPELAPPTPNESKLDETAIPPPLPLSPHSAQQAEELAKEIETALNEKPDDLASVAEGLDKLSQLVARLLEQKTGVRPPAPPVLDYNDVLLSCTVTLRDQTGVLKHLDVTAPMYGVLADSELSMAHNTLNAMMSMLIIRPLTTAWTQHVTSRMQRPQLVLRVKDQSDSVIPGTEEDDFSAIEKR